MRVIFLCISLFLLWANVHGQKSILAVFAHPDDETTITPVLAKYASEGWEITIVIATDGRYGFTPHFGVDDSDSLVRIRELEIACVCDVIGINPPVFLGAHDGMKGLEGVDAQFRQFSMISDALEKIVLDVQPQVIITMGPEGDSGHPDHRMVSAIVTQIVQKSALNLDLYYHGWSKKQSDKYEGWNLHYVDEEHLDTRISYSEDDEEKHFRAIRCYESQYDRIAMEEWITLDREDEENILYFRKWTTSKTKRTSF